MNKDFLCPVCKCAPLITDYCPSCSRIEGAAPLPDEVREIVERLRAYPTRDGLLAAEMIERLAAVNTNLNTENALLLKWKLEGAPPDCVVVLRAITEEGKCVLATPGNYRTYQDQWTALIAAGEKP